MSVLNSHNQDIVISAFIKPLEITTKAGIQKKLDLLQPLREWLDGVEIHHRKLAYFIAKLIPAQCPFERDIVVFGRKIAHIPPLCKLNPLYDQLVGLRFRALCYLVDECGEDIQSFC